MDDGSDGSNNNANDSDNDEYGKDIDDDDDDDDDDYDDENSSHVTSRLFLNSSRRSTAKYPGLGRLRYFIRSVMAASSRAQWQARNVPFDLLHGP